MADTFSLRFEIDASRAEAGAKKFVNAISAINKSLDNLDAKAEAAFSKLMSGGSSGGDFSALAKNLGKLNGININPATVKSISSIGVAFQNLKGPSAAAMKNITSFASTIPALLNSFNVSGNFADSVGKISSALGGFKVPATSKVEALKSFGEALQTVAPSLRIAGNFSGIANLGAALGSFKAPSEKAVSNMKAFFNALNNGGAKASVSSSLTNGIINLSSAVGGMKAPSSTSVKNLRDLFTALATFKPVSGTSSISAITQAFSNFKGPTASQIKNIQAFVQMLGTLKVPPNVGQISAAIQQIGNAAGNANKNLNGFKTNLGGINAGKASSGVTGLTTNLRGLENAFSGTFQAASVFRTLIGSITIGTLSKSIYDANTNFNAFKSTLLAVNSGDLQKTGEEMRYTEDMANRLGQRVADIQESFGSFSVSSKLAGVSTEQTRSIFEATITAMTVLHRSSDRTKLALLALEQMMSKGTVSSEELRRQLGEQLPGAVNLMARALGVGTDELQDMLKKGEILASDALPKFAAEVQKTYGGSLASALKNAGAQFNLLSNAVYDLQVVMGQSGSMDALAKAFEKIKNAISAPEFLSFAAQFGERTGKAISLLGDAFAFLVKNIDSVITVLKGLLIINVARFIQSFSSMVLGSIASASAWKETLLAVRVALLGTTVAANGATVAVGLFARAGAIASVIAGPIGLAAIALGVLGAAWLASGEKGAEFSTVVDTSKESLDRYNDSLKEMTMGQLIAENEKVKTTLDETNKKIQETRTTFENLMANAPTGKRFIELDNLKSQLQNVREVLDDTGMTYDQFLVKLSKTEFKSPQAKQLAQAYLDLQNAVAVYGAKSDQAYEQVARLNAMMNGTSSAHFAGEMANAAGAASSMADIVSAAADKVAEANAKMNLSKAQSVLADDFIKLAGDNKTTLDNIAKSEGSLTEKRELAAEQTKKYGDAYKYLNGKAEELVGINKKVDANKAGETVLEKMGSAATAAAQKIADAKKELADFNSYAANTKGLDPAKVSNARAQLQEKIKDAQDSANKPKGGGGKGKGGGGGAGAAYLDDAAKATNLYNKEVASLDSMLSKHRITQDQYNDALARLKEKYADSALGANGFTTEFTKLRDELSPAGAQLEEFTRKQNILKEAFDQGKISGEEYLDLLTRLKKNYSEQRTGNSWVDGINKGLTDLTKTSDDFVNDVAGAVSNAFNGLEDALVSWVTTGKMDFKSLATSILGDIARIVIRYTIIQPIIKALSGIMGGLGGGLGGGGMSTGFFPAAPTGGFGGGAITGLYAKGGVFNSGKVTAFAKGGLTNGSNNGIVSSPTLFDMAGGKTGLMGEAGSEAIMPLKRGSDGSLGVVASGAVQAASSNVYVQPQVRVNIDNRNGGESSVSTKKNKDGGLDVNVLIEQIKDAVAGDVAAGGSKLNKAFEGRYGANPAVGNKR